MNLSRFNLRRQGQISVEEVNTGEVPLPSSAGHKEGKDLKHPINHFCAIEAALRARVRQIYRLFHIKFKVKVLSVEDL
jgi:hypothetical protein